MLLTYSAFIDIVARVLLGLGVLAGLVCVVDWAIRTRKIGPFSGVARFFRRTVDPMLRPMEAIIVRRGGQPASAPLWVFLGIVVAGIVILWLLRMVGGLLLQLSAAASEPRLLPILLAEWALEFLYVAILVRVFSSWLPISPYSRWIRWSYVTTEWLLAPLRRIIPPFGAIDVSPLGALLLIWLARGIIGRL
jgi:YggT family protein